MVPMVLGALQKALAIFAAIVCFCALLGYGDSVRRAPRAAFALPPPPVAESERDGALGVLVLAGPDDGDATPLAGATLHAFWDRDGRYFDAGVATSDAGGRAELGRLPRGRIWLLADAKGYA